MFSIITFCPILAIGDLWNKSIFSRNNVYCKQTTDIWKNEVCFPIVGVNLAFSPDFNMIICPTFISSEILFDLYIPPPSAIYKKS